MRSNQGVEQVWVRLLGRKSDLGEIGIEQIEEGYFAVVKKVTRSSSNPGPEDYYNLEGLVPRLGNTRAVSLGGRFSGAVEDFPTLHSWAGGSASAIEEGHIQAFGVVDIVSLGQRLSDSLAAKGWKVQRSGEGVKVTDGLLTEKVSVPRLAVRMVLSRSTFEGAIATIIKEVSDTLIRDARYFVRFRKHFRDFEADVLDHYFVVYPEASRTALGWDYWELSEESARAANERFRAGIDQIETLLRDASTGWQDGFLSVCASSLRKD